MEPELDTKKLLLLPTYRCACSVLFPALCSRGRIPARVYRMESMYYTCHSYTVRSCVVSVYILWELPLLGAGTQKQKNDDTVNYYTCVQNCVEETDGIMVFQEYCLRAKPTQNVICLNQIVNSKTTRARALSAVACTRVR